MSKNKAIKALKIQRSKLNDNFVYSEYSIWHGATLQYIENLFGKESNAYGAFCQYRPYDMQNIHSNNYAAIKANLEKLLDEFISMIRTDFYIKPPKTNFLHTMDPNILVFILTAAGVACFLFGKYTSDINSNTYKQDYKSLSDSFSVYKIDVNRNQIAPLRDSLIKCKNKLPTR